MILDAQEVCKRKLKQVTGTISELASGSGVSLHHVGISLDVKSESVWGQSIVGEQPDLLLDPSYQSSAGPRNDNCAFSILPDDFGICLFGRRMCINHDRPQAVASVCMNNRCKSF